MTVVVILARIILGLLDLAPMTGYELKRHCDTTIHHFWSADRAQIYRTLSQLVDDGLATVETVPGAGGPDRQVHHLTERGRTTLHAWLASPLDHQPERDAFLARLFFAGSLAPPQLDELLTARRRTARALLDTLEQMHAATPQPADRRGVLRLAALDNGIAHARTELDWLATLQEQLA